MEEYLVTRSYQRQMQRVWTFPKLLIRKDLQLAHLTLSPTKFSLIHDGLSALFPYTTDEKMFGLAQNFLRSARNLKESDSKKLDILYSTMAEFLSNYEKSLPDKSLLTYYKYKTDDQIKKELHLEDDLKMETS